MLELLRILLPTLTALLNERRLLPPYNARSRQGPRASPPDHSRITHSRHRTALGGHQRTPAWSISYSRGRRGSLSDTGGHGISTVRDREAPGSNSGPPTKIQIQIRPTRVVNVTSALCWCSWFCSGFRPRLHRATVDLPSHLSRLTFRPRFASIVAPAKVQGQGGCG